MDLSTDNVTRELWYDDSAREGGVDLSQDAQRDAASGWDSAREGGVDLSRHLLQRRKRQMTPPARAGWI